MQREKEERNKERRRNNLCRITPSRIFNQKISLAFFLEIFRLDLKEKK